MTLGYSQYFPWGEPTYFKEKVLCSDISCYTVYGIRYRPKIHSIREDPKDRWPPVTGIIHHVYNNRSKERECFLMNACVSVQKIEILHMMRSHIVRIDDKEYCRLPQDWNGSCKYEDIHRMTELVHNDGFDTIDDFFRWFKKDFKGKLIHWTEKRYE